MCGFQGTQKPYTISGDNGERDPPVPIPNTEVKPFSADGTWLETTWESRTLPDSMKKDSPLTGWVLFSFHLQRFYSLVVSNERATLYLEPKSSAPCGRFSEMKAGIAKERTARLLRFPGWESRTLPDCANPKSSAHSAGAYCASLRSTKKAARFIQRTAFCIFE